MSLTNAMNEHKTGWRSMGRKVWRWYIRQKDHEIPHWRDDIYAVNWSKGACHEVFRGNTVSARRDDWVDGLEAGETWLVKYRSGTIIVTLSEWGQRVARDLVKGPKG